MTRGAVRCSAWLGVRSDLRQRWRVVANRRVKVTAALLSAASGRLRCSADGDAAKCGWGAGRKLLDERTDARTGDVERRCAADSESEAQTGITPLIAARVAAWPKPGNAKLSKLVRHAPRADARTCQPTPESRAADNRPNYSRRWLRSQSWKSKLSGDARERLTTPSSATAERGAVAAW